MSATDSVVLPGPAGLDLPRRRHDLMIELYRVDRARERAAAGHQPERVAELEHYRDRIAESLAALVS